MLLHTNGLWRTSEKMALQSRAGISSSGSWRKVDLHVPFHWTSVASARADLSSWLVTQVAHASCRRSRYAEAGCWPDPGKSQYRGHCVVQALAQTMRRVSWHATPIFIASTFLMERLTLGTSIATGRHNDTRHRGTCTWSQGHAETAHRNRSEES